jgi:hypothetical protein
LGLGSFFVLLTAFFWYVAWGELPSSIERPNLPPNLFAAFTFCFFGAPGLFLLALGIVDLRREAHVRQERELYPHEPWRWDYGWDTNGTSDIGLRQSMKGLVGVILAVGIVAPINCVFISEADFSLAIVGFVVLGLFDLILLLSLGTVLYRIITQVVHGRARLKFQHFPLRLGERVELALQSHPAFDDVQELTATLRCVEEQSEARLTTRTGSGSGKTTTVTKVGLQRYCEKNTISDDEVRSFTFELPADPDLQTRLSEVPSLHWELLVVGKRPEGDCQKRFLLPIY